MLKKGSPRPEKYGSDWLRLGQIRITKPNGTEIWSEQARIYPNRANLIHIGAKFDIPDQHTASEEAV